MKNKKFLPLVILVGVVALLGLGLSVLCLIAFGSEQFLIPAMAAILGVLTLLRKHMEKGGDAA